MTRIQSLTTADFDAALNAGGAPLLLDFWAPWCGPCRALAPVLEDVAEDLGDELRVAKVDIEAEPDLADRLGVQGIPLLVLYRDGKEVARATGTQSRARLTEWIESRL